MLGDFCIPRNQALIIGYLDHVFDYSGVETLLEKIGQ